MKSARNEATIGVLNETTNTVHKHRLGASEFKTECGVTNNIAPDYLRRIPIDQALTSGSACKCGRCFPEAGGY